MMAFVHHIFVLIGHLTYHSRWIWEFSYFNIKSAWFSIVTVCLAKWLHKLLLVHWHQCLILLHPLTLLCQYDHIIPILRAAIQMLKGQKSGDHILQCCYHNWSTLHLFINCWQNDEGLYNYTILFQILELQCRCWKDGVQNWIRRSCFTMLLP